MRLLNDRKGSEFTEVGLILALVVIVAIAVLRGLGVNITEVFQAVSSAIGGH